MIGMKRNILKKKKRIFKKNESTSKRQGKNKRKK